VAEQSKPAQAWSRRVALLLADSTRASEFADLLATVDQRWHDAVRVEYIARDLWIVPSGAAPVRGPSLQVKRSKSGFSMDLIGRQSFSGSTTVARARATLLSAPADLARMLRTMFEEREITPPNAGSGTWGGIVNRFRGYAAEDEAKGALLESVDTALRERCEIYDNGQIFGIIRIGDSEGDGEGIWISQVSDGWSFIHRVESPQDNATRVLGEATTSVENAAETLNGLLADIVSRTPAPELSAQDAYRQLLRDHVGPALRHHGYSGSGGDFGRTAGEYRVSINFQKSRFSTRARVDYLLNIHVVHPSTAELFNQASEEAGTPGREHQSPSAGMYRAQFPGLTGRRPTWISLRPDDDLSAHAAALLADIYAAAFPVIEEQLRLPLPVPTPPAQRGPWSSTRSMPRPGAQH
jgi:hypothetical protein